MGINVITHFDSITEVLEDKFKRDLQSLGKIYVLISSLLYYLMLLFAKFANGGLTRNQYLHNHPDQGSDGIRFQLHHTYPPLRESLLPISEPHSHKGTRRQKHTWGIQRGADIQITRNPEHPPGNHPPKHWPIFFSPFEFLPAEGVHLRQADCALPGGLRGNSHHHGSLYLLLQIGGGT